MSDKKKKKGKSAKEKDAGKKKKSAGKKTSADKKTSAEETAQGSSVRRWARISAIAAAAVILFLCVAGNYYVHHPADWLAEHEGFFTAPLEAFGDPTAFITDALGWSGRDAVNTPDDPPPTGQVFFAGAPVREGDPCPSDIAILDRGEFQIGWSPSLRHPVWVAYHVPAEAKHDSGKRPGFRKDPGVKSAPAPAEYTNSGYDRGHMAPNRAIVTRFGPEAQLKTFQMSNIAPQLPSLNRGPWREMEQRIADLWTAKYGEIWVIAGCYTPRDARDRFNLGKTNIDVPENFYMVIAAQTEDAVRVLAVDLGQPRRSWRDQGRRLRRWSWPAHAIVSVDELERRTGLDFFPDMQKSLQMSLESDVPTRLWPVRFVDIFKLIMLRFS